MLTNRHKWHCCGNPIGLSGLTAGYVMYAVVFKYMMDAQSEEFSIRLGWPDGAGTDAFGAMSRFLVSCPAWVCRREDHT
jgi:hypothetical protein